MNFKSCFRTLPLLLFLGRVPNMLEKLPSHKGDMDPLLAELMLWFLLEEHLFRKSSPSLRTKHSSSVLVCRLKASLLESSDTHVWYPSSLSIVMELRQLLQLLSLDKRLRSRRAEPGRGPNKVDSSMSIFSKLGQLAASPRKQKTKTTGRWIWASLLTSKYTKFLFEGHKKE